MTAVLETRHRPRKKLPDIPPEELALHGKTDLENGNTYHELPAEVQVQFMRHVHRRSHSLTGLDTVKSEKQQCVVTEKEKSESESKQQNVEELQNRQSTINTEKDIPAFIMSLPTTPVSSRKLSTASLKTTEEKEELMKELRWHYKQFVKTAKRNKETHGNAGAISSTSSVICTSRCDQPKCGKTVDILERVAVENHIFHKSCFVCAICGAWLNHFNYCFVPDHDKFYCMQHYQDIENAFFGVGEDVRQAMGIGPGVQQQFNFTPDAMDGTKETVKEINQVNNNSVRIMKEKIFLLSKRGKKLVKKEKKLKSYLEKFKGSDVERQALWLEWYSTAQEKNTTVRRETELSFKVRELELVGKYTKLEKNLRELSEKDDNLKTEYDKCKEKELLQDMLEVVEKREQLIADMEDTKKRYVEEDNALTKDRRKTGFNEPDVIKEATAASKDAMKVSETVKQAPSIVNQPDLCCVLF